MDSNRSDAGRQRVLTAVAILALLLVAAGVFAGMYALARGGTFDGLLRRTPTRVVAAATRTATPAPTQPTVAQPTNTQPTATLARTITAGGASPTVRLTLVTSQTPLATATSTLTVTPMPSPTMTADPLVSVYVVEYLGCDPRGSDIGIVKGQIFDRAGKVVVGAEVRVQLDDWAYDQPAISNGEGWYEFYLQKGLKVKITSLRIDGREIELAGNEDQVFVAQGGCFEYVNLRQK